MIGAHDLWTTAATMPHDLTHGPANVRDFEGVPGLALEDRAATDPSR